MRKLASIAALAVAIALPAEASELRGVWSATIPEAPDYIATVIIDAQGRVTLDSPMDHGRPAHFRGYVKATGSAGMEMVLTNGDDVVRLQCRIESANQTRCQTLYPNGKVGMTSIMRRMGDAPASLIPGSISQHPPLR